MKFPLKMAAVAAVAVGVYIYDKAKSKVRTLSKKESEKLAEGESIEAEYVVVEPEAKKAE